MSLRGEHSFYCIVLIKLQKPKSLNFGLRGIFFATKASFNTTMHMALLSFIQHRINARCASTTREVLCLLVWFIKSVDQIYQQIQFQVQMVLQIKFRLIVVPSSVCYILYIYFKVLSVLIINTFISTQTLDYIYFWLAPSVRSSNVTFALLQTDI